MKLIDPSNVLGYQDSNDLASEFDAIVHDVEVAYKNAGLDLVRLAECDESIIIEWAYVPRNKV